MSIEECPIWLIRHGETEWSLSGAHTGRTDIPLTAHGAESAKKIGGYLRNVEFSLVLSSPRLRALETCRLAGFGDAAVIDQDLAEWDYGSYEGRKTAEIRQQRPDWDIWDDGVLDGESIADVAVRAERVIQRALQTKGKVALFSHGHLLRILTAVWLGLPPTGGRLFALPAGAICTLGFERETKVITSWGVRP